MKKQYHLTKHGKRELEEELTELVERRGEIADRIAEARSYGDLSENTEYSSARDEQNRMETRIAEIEEILQNADVIRSTNSEKVRLGSTVTLQNGARAIYKIVGTVEADPLDGKISNESPLGQALIGQKIGDSVALDTPKGKINYKILGIE